MSQIGGYDHLVAVREAAKRRKETAKAPMSLSAKLVGDLAVESVFEPSKRRHGSAASIFQIGVSLGRQMASSGRLTLVLQRLHSTSSQPSPPLRHWPIVGDGCAGPP